MNKLILTALFGIFVSSTSAADTNCEEKATDKKLSGAAKNSFIKKCLQDSVAEACVSKASDKKLSGAAKDSFMKKCEKNAVEVK